jgi:sulfate adenylyltransferase
MRHLRALALLLVLLLTASCGGPAGDPSEPVRVGAIYPLSGTQGMGGIDEYHGVQVAAELINAEGGIGGRPVVLDLPRHRFHGSLCRTPEATRAALAVLGHDTVVAFQTRNPMHRIHEEITKRAARRVGGALLIHPAVGVTRPQDVHHALRVEAYEVLVREYYDAATTLLSLMPLAMRFAGPREAVWHMIVRRNYGASHLILGRDHAGPGKDSRGEPFYGPYEALETAQRYAAEVGVTPVGFEELVYLADEDRYEEVGKVPPGARTCSISGTQVREEYLAKGRKLPEWFTRPEVAEILQRTVAGGAES